MGTTIHRPLSSNTCNTPHVKCRSTKILSDFYCWTLLNPTYGVLYLRPVQVYETWNIREANTAARGLQCSFSFTFFSLSWFPFHFPPTNGNDWYSLSWGGGKRGIFPEWKSFGNPHCINTYSSQCGRPAGVPIVPSLVVEESRDGGNSRTPPAM